MVPNLLQYVSNDNYYARTKVNSKIIRESMKTADGYLDNGQAAADRLPEKAPRGPQSPRSAAVYEGRRSFQEGP
jgi:hypothetical protein